MTRSDPAVEAPRVHATVWGKDRPAELDAITALTKILGSAPYDMTSMTVVARSARCPMNLRAQTVRESRRSIRWAWVLTNVGVEVELMADDGSGCLCHTPEAWESYL